MIFGSDTIGAQLHTYLTVVLGTSAIFIVGIVAGIIIKDKSNEA